MGGIEKREAGDEVVGEGAEEVDEPRSLSVLS